MDGPFAGVSPHGREFFGQQAPVVGVSLDGVGARAEAGEAAPPSTLAGTAAPRAWRATTRADPTGSVSSSISSPVR